MRTGTTTPWWRQLGGMSQGMLFLHGHIVRPDASLPEPSRTHHAHDAAGQARHQRALQRLSARRLHGMASLSLFR